MICTLVEFPADLHELERTHVETVRSEVIAAVALVRRAPARTGNLSNDEANFIAEAISSRLSGSIVEWGTRLSPAVRPELVDDGVSVRLRWHQAEANRRSERGRRLEAERLAAEQRAAERARRAQMRVALDEVRANVAGAQQTTSSVEHVRSGYVVRSRDGEAPVQARGCEEVEIEELVRGRRDGDRFFFVRAPDFTPAALAPLKHWPDPLAEVPGTMANALAKAQRRREELGGPALDLLLRVVLAVALAHERIRAGAEAFHSFAYGALRAWSKNPAGLELDVEIAPFGIDLSPPADDFAARVALLELAELPPRRE